MDKHRCKLCTRSFANGRALGGHMKAHLAALPPTRPQLGCRTESPYSSSGEENEIDGLEVEESEKAAALAYRLRENPKKSAKFADPEFSGSVVQDRESETESRNPTRRRSKRTRKSDFGDDLKKLKVKIEEQSLSQSPPEPEPVSSVSDASSDEDVAMCLMQLSRDVWMRYEEEDGNKSAGILKLESKEEVKASKIRGGKFRCEKCTKVFRSSPALLAHKKICSLNETEIRNSDGNERIFECPFCLKVFGSGQALGGHKRSHLRNSDSSEVAATATVPAAADEGSLKIEIKMIDLNLPAPMEDDEFSVLSDA